MHEDLEVTHDQITAPIQATLPRPVTRSHRESSSSSTCSSGNVSKCIFVPLGKGLTIGWSTMNSKLKIKCTAQYVQKPRNVARWHILAVIGYA